MRATIHPEPHEERARVKINMHRGFDILENLSNGSKGGLQRAIVTVGLLLNLEPRVILLVAAEALFLASLIFTIYSYQIHYWLLPQGITHEKISAEFKENAHQGARGLGAVVGPAAIRVLLLKERES